MNTCSTIRTNLKAERTWFQDTGKMVKIGTIWKA